MALQVGDGVTVGGVEAGNQCLDLAAMDDPAETAGITRDTQRLGRDHPLHGHRTRHPRSHRYQLEKRLHERLEALAHRRRDGEGRQSEVGEELGARLRLPRVDQVELVQHHHGGALEQVGVVCLELAAQRLQVDDRVVGQVHDEGEQAGAGDVPQELEAEPAAEVCVLDDAGHVCDRQSLMVALEDAEVGAEGGEGVSGDLGPGVRHGGQQAGLAGVGVAHQSDVGDRPQLEPQPELLAGRAVLREARRAAVRVREGGVAAPAHAAGGDQRALAHLDQVRQHLAAVGVARDGPDRHGDRDVRAAVARAVAALPLLAHAGLVHLPGHQPVERGDVVDRLEPHAAAVAAVAAVGATLGDVLQAHERHGAVAALAAQGGDLDDVTEGHGGTPLAGSTPRRAHRALLGARSSRTLTHGCARGPSDRGRRGDRSLSSGRR